MERFSIETEEKKERGRNVEIHSFFVRHGENTVSATTPDTGLTELGREDSLKFGQSLNEKDAIKSYSSDTERTEKTANEIVEGSLTEKKMNHRINKELSFIYSKEGDFSKKVMDIKRGIMGNDFSNLTKEEQDKRIHEATTKQTDYYLGFGGKRPDPETYSPLETASTLARRLDIYNKMLEKLYSGSSVDLINASHDFNLSAFLKEIIVRKIDNKEVRGFDSIEEIGGPINYNEGFEVVGKTDDEGNKNIKMYFRGQEYDIDMKKMDELLEIAERLELEEKQK